MKRTGLRRAYDLIRDEEHWCQGATALDENGVDVTHGLSQDQVPVRWCAAGALAQAGTTREECDAVVDAALKLFPETWVAAGRYGPLVKVNDQFGHAAIMQVFEKAIVEMEGSL